MARIQLWFTITGFSNGVQIVKLEWDIEQTFNDLLIIYLIFCVKIPGLESLFMWYASSETFGIKICFILHIYIDIVWSLSTQHHSDYVIIYILSYINRITNIVLQHFNSPGHSLSDLSIIVLEKVKKNDDL